MATPKAPTHLSAEARKFWRDVVAQFEMQPYDLQLLGAACESLDRMREAQKTVAADGPYVDGRFGLRAHPGLAVERDSRIALMRALRELALDIEPPPESRPPRRY